MCDRSGLAPIVGLPYQLVQWWHSHEAPFDDRIYTTIVTVKAAEFWTCNIGIGGGDTELLCWSLAWWIGAIGWCFGTMVALI